MPSPVRPHRKGITILEFAERLLDEAAAQQWFECIHGPDVLNCVKHVWETVGVVKPDWRSNMGDIGSISDAPSDYQSKGYFRPHDYFAIKWKSSISGPVIRGFLWSRIFH